LLPHLCKFLRIIPEFLRAGSHWDSGLRLRLRVGASRHTHQNAQRSAAHSHLSRLVAGVWRVKLNPTLAGFHCRHMAKGGTEVTRSHSSCTAAATPLPPGEKTRFVLYGKTSEGAMVARTPRGERKRVSEQRLATWCRSYTYAGDDTRMTVHIARDDVGRRRPYVIGACPDKIPDNEIKSNECAGCVRK
jgi:hypothetical protein